jgi:hypothetical protein
VVRLLGRLVCDRLHSPREAAGVRVGEEDPSADRLA